MKVVGGPCMITVFRDQPIMPLLYAAVLINAKE